MLKSRTRVHAMKLSCVFGLPSKIVKHAMKADGRKLCTERRPVVNRQCKRHYGSGNRLSSAIRCVKFTVLALDIRGWDYAWDSEGEETQAGRESGTPRQAWHIAEHSSARYVFHHAPSFWPASPLQSRRAVTYVTRRPTLHILHWHT